MSLYKSKYICKASLLKSTNPLPIFRDENVDFKVQVEDSIEDEYKLNLGKNCGKRILPYSNQDIYDRDIKDVEIDSIVLENEFLKATFLPSLGGRLISLFDKENDKELLFASKNIQPCNLSIRNAWFSGGIEFNVGQYGHALTTMDNVYAASVTDKDNNKFLRIGEFDKMHEIYWHMDFHLPPKSKFLYLKCELNNFEDKVKSTYCWINTAIIQEKETRVFASNRSALFLDPFLQQKAKGYSKMTLPRIENFKDLDASYPGNFPFSNEYFFTCDKDKVPYEVTINKDGYGVFDFSTKALTSRKMFCWGNQNGGRRWQEYLNGTKEVEYFEAQAGISATQLHGTYIKSNETISFTQAFGAIQVDKDLAQHLNYDIADKAVINKVNSMLSNIDINKIDKELEKSCSIREDEILNKGSMFSLLDAKLKNINLPDNYSFMTNSINESEILFKDMIENTYTYSPQMFNNYVFPPNSFDSVLEKYSDPYSQYLKGILLTEKFEYSQALKVLNLAYKEEPHCLIARAIAQIHHRLDNIELRDEYYLKAINTCTKEIELLTISSEYSLILRLREEFDKSKSLLELLDKLIKNYRDVKSIADVSDSIALDKGVLASHLGNFEDLEHCLFDRELSCIREGANPFISLYNEYMSLKISKEQNILLNNELRERIAKEYKIPSFLDFTMEASEED